MPIPKLYYETKDGLPAYGDIMTAIDGFQALDYEPRGFHWAQSKSPVYPDFNYEYQDVVIGGTVNMRRHLLAVGRLPEPIDYPLMLTHDLTGRHVEKTTLERAIMMTSNGNSEVFVTPVLTKQQAFDAKVYGRKALVDMLSHHEPETPVYVSDVMVIRAEFRVFVHKGIIVDIRRYAGNFRSAMPPLFRIEKMVQAYTNAPIAYTLDVAMQYGQGVALVEVNDFWAIGAYGLDPVKYAEMLRDRYHQIRGW